MVNIPETRVPITGVSLAAPDWYKYWKGITAWQNYTPTIVSGTGTITAATAAGRYLKFGRMVFLQITGEITTNGTGATSVVFSLPFPTASGTLASITSLSGVERNIGHTAIFGEIRSTTPSTLVVYNYDGTYPGGDGAIMALNGIYEADS